MASDGIIVSTMTAADSNGDNFAIDTASSALTVVLTPALYTSLAFERSVSSIAGVDTKWVVTMKGVLSSTVVSGNANILVYFPREQVCDPVSGSIVCSIVTATGFSYNPTSCTVTYWS